MPVGVLLVRLLGGDADDGERQHIVQGVDGGVECAAEDGHGAGDDADQQPDAEDCEVGEQNDDQYTADACGPIRTRGR